MIIDLKEISTADAQDWLQHAVAPRPIGLVSTVDSGGSPNLSPFSFFNLFSARPPVVIFSPSRRVRDHTVKHTLENIREVPEAVVHICDLGMVDQISLASGEYPKGTDEFLKAGFEKEPATLVRPPMAKSARIKLECAVTGIVPLGDEGGAGNLVICSVLRMHVHDSVLGADGRIDPLKTGQVARLGGDWYCRADANSMFRVKKPGRQPAIGVDALPASLRDGGQFSPAELAKLASAHALPDLPPNITNIAFRRARRLLGLGLLEEAWQVLSQPQTILS